jgi:hypothetical protein
MDAVPVEALSPLTPSTVLDTQSADLHRFVLHGKLAPNIVHVQRGGNG